MTWQILEDVNKINKANFEKEPGFSGDYRMDSISKRYYLEFASAFVRGSIPETVGYDDISVFRKGTETGLRLHRFKRMPHLPRVRRIIGFLRQIAPANLLDIGSGRGVFLWPLLEEFPDLNVHCVDIRDDRVREIQAVANGGVSRLTASVGDVAVKLPFAESSFDGVTMLEVLEHLARPDRAVAEALRVARRFVAISVPSKPDTNPEHIHLFSERRLSDLFIQAGAPKISIEYVLNHMVALCRFEKSP